MHLSFSRLKKLAALSLIMFALLATAIYLLLFREVRMPIDFFANIIHPQATEYKIYGQKNNKASGVVYLIDDKYPGDEVDKYTSNYLLKKGWSRYVRNNDYIFPRWEVHLSGKGAKAPLTHRYMSWWKKASDGIVLHYVKVYESNHEIKKCDKCSEPDNDQVTVMIDIFPAKIFELLEICLW